jgi:hypothetical protein
MRQGRRIERRRHDRYKLPALYTHVLVEPRIDGEPSQLSGHAYDISNAGVRIELDQPLPVGQTVHVHLQLPGGIKDVNAGANVIWVSTADDDPGPRRMALQFTAFDTAGDQDQLDGYLQTGLHRIAA